MRKGGSLIAFTACIFAIIAAIAMVAVAQFALMSSGDTTMERDQAITCVAFAFGALACAALGKYVRNPVPGYFELVISVIGTILAPVAAMPFLALSAIGSVFMIIGGHIDHHSDAKARREDKGQPVL
jgi:peptidoglycan/LPS O-acetylase OafA/YrhL